jgi:HSP20 family molecular chaperone IbpA
VDLEVSVQTGVLSVRAEPVDETPVNHDFGFRYGTYAWHEALPLGSDARDVSTACHNGILTIRIGLEAEHAAAAHIVPVERQ